jgi:hypothetical protein
VANGKREGGRTTEPALAPRHMKAVMSKRSSTHSAARVARKVSSAFTCGQAVVEPESQWCRSNDTISQRPCRGQC